jgi:hypothetical protein
MVLNNILSFLIFILIKDESIPLFKINQLIIGARKEGSLSSRYLLNLIFFSWVSKLINQQLILVTA